MYAPSHASRRWLQRTVIVESKAKVIHLNLKHFAISPRFQMLFDSCLSNIKLNAQHFKTLMNSDQMWWKDFGNESKLIRRELNAIKTRRKSTLHSWKRDSIFTLCIPFNLIVFARVEKWNRGKSCQLSLPIGLPLQTSFGPVSKQKSPKISEKCVVYSLRVILIDI